MTATERRLQAEWDLLQQLAQLNPGRLTSITSDDHTFRLTLREAPVRLANSSNSKLVSTHDVRVVYPAFFPAAPLELYVDQAFFHPNVHPQTGFVCVWTRHRPEHTVEHALHKLVAMMCGRLCNLESVHQMQPEALDAAPPGNAEWKPLTGITHDRFSLPEETPRRRRLS